MDMQLSQKIESQKPLCFCKQRWHYESTGHKKYLWIKLITSWVSLNYTESETNKLITEISFFQKEKLQDLNIPSVWSQLAFRIPKYQHRGGSAHWNSKLSGACDLRKWKLAEKRSGDGVEHCQMANRNKGIEKNHAEVEEKQLKKLNAFRSGEMTNLLPWALQELACETSAPVASGFATPAYCIKSFLVMGL